MAYEPKNTKDKAYWLEEKAKALRKRANGKTLTLEETASAIWDPDETECPLSSMAILKIERKALDKLKRALLAKNIKGLDDLFEAKHREYAKPIASIYGSSR